MKTYIKINLENFIGRLNKNQYESLFDSMTDIGEEAIEAMVSLFDNKDFSNHYWGFINKSEFVLKFLLYKEGKEKSKKIKLEWEPYGRILWSCYVNNSIGLKKKTLLTDSFRNACKRIIPGLIQRFKMDHEFYLEHFEELSEYNEKFLKANPNLRTDSVTVRDLISDESSAEKVFKEKLKTKYAFKTLKNLSLSVIKENRAYDAIDWGHIAMRHILNGDEIPEEWVPIMENETYENGRIFRLCKKKDFFLLRYILNERLEGRTPEDADKYIFGSKEYKSKFCNEWEKMDLFFYMDPKFLEPYILYKDFKTLKSPIACTTDSKSRSILSERSLHSYRMKENVFLIGKQYTLEQATSLLCHLFDERKNLPSDLLEQIQIEFQQDIINAYKDSNFLSFRQIILDNQKDLFKLSAKKDWADAFYQLGIPLRDKIKGMYYENYTLTDIVKFFVSSRFSNLSYEETINTMSYEEIENEKKKAVNLCDLISLNHAITAKKLIDKKII